MEFTSEIDEKNLNSYISALAVMLGIEIGTYTMNHVVDIKDDIFALIQEGERVGRLVSSGVK